MPPPCLERFLVSKRLARGPKLAAPAVAPLLRRQTTAPHLPRFHFATLTCLVLYSTLAATAWPEAFTFRQLHKSCYYALSLSPLNLPGAFADNPYRHSFNLPMWTIPYELRCYGLLAVLALVGVLTRRRVLLLLTGGLLALATLQSLLHPDFPRIPLIEVLLGKSPQSVPRLAGAFMLGVTA